MGHKKIILLFGPTTSGKSKLASDIAKELNGEIINADSMQVYKEVKVLSARPYNKNIKHHLYGFVSAKENFSVGSWHKLASKKIKELIKKGKIAVVVGGTGLYFKVLIDGLVEIPEVPKIDYNNLNFENIAAITNYYNKCDPKIFKGINLGITEAQPFYEIPEAIRFFGNEKIIGPIPYLIVIPFYQELEVSFQKAMFLLKQKIGYQTKKYLC